MGWQIILIFSTLFIFLTSCGNTESNSVQSSGKDGWLKGNTPEKFEVIAGQLKGFDMAMVETGYRYQELYWAGQDGNWEYATYQLGKIKLAIENGLERRPKRAKSAEHFLAYTLPEMQKSINGKDTVLFNQNFNLLTNACNSCHAMEQVSSFIVNIPDRRMSPIKLPK